MALHQHYAPGDLSARVVAALAAAGKASGRLTIDELAPLDQFHTRGKMATVELGHMAQLRPGLRVLDIGGGLGGPARTLATEFGCRVIVLDFTESYCRVGEMLTERAGLAERVAFQIGDALSAPFADASFDVVWMQHVNMNIEAKQRLYSESYRLLQPDGVLAIHEIVAGAQAPVHLPVPWSSTAHTSFLWPAADLCRVIEQCGFVPVAYRDGTDAALAWFRERAAAAGDPPVLGLHLLLGEGFKPAFGNLLKNLEEQRVGVIAAVYGR